MWLILTLDRQTDVPVGPHLGHFTRWSTTPTVAWGQDDLAPIGMCVGATLPAQPVQPWPWEHRPLGFLAAGHSESSGSSFPHLEHGVLLSFWGVLSALRDPQCPHERCMKGPGKTSAGCMLLLQEHVNLSSIVSRDLHMEGEVVAKGDEHTTPVEMHVSLRPGLWGYVSSPSGSASISPDACSGLGTV